MIKDLFLSILGKSVSASAVILILLILSSFLNKRYAVKWKYWIWISLAFYLIIPFDIKLPLRQFVINVPEQMVTPLAVDTGNVVPIMLQMEKESAGMTLLDMVAVLWLAGCISFLLVHILSFSYYKAKLTRNGILVKDEHILHQLRRLSRELKIKRRIPIVTYSGAGSPMVIGFFHPILVLPDREYTNEELFFILKHELIHLKRHDIYFKLLFVIANALHWFNPLIYRMQKEAVVDMELSCDERVIQGTAYAVRKVYSETLFSTLHKQYTKTTALTTQFYGGTQIMKKRFKNILTKSQKKNGCTVLVCTICIMLLSGMITGCSILESKSDEVQGQTQTDRDNAADVPAQVPETEEILPENSENTEDDLSADSQEIKNIVEKFATAYFEGDVDAIQEYLTSPYEWEISTYEGTDAVSDVSVNGLDISVKGLDEIENKEIGEVCVVSLEYKSSADADTFQYLTIEMLKQAEGWKVQFYGVEG